MHFYYKIPISKLNFTIIQFQTTDHYFYPNKYFYSLLAVRAAFLLKYLKIMLYPKSPFMRNPLVESQIINRNPATTGELLEWLCQTPTITTYRVNSLKTTVAQFKQFLKVKLTENYENPPTIYELPEIPELLCIEKLKTPLPAIDGLRKEIIVDACCGAAVLRGAHIFAPGVVAMETGTKLDEEVQVYADLAGKCKRGTNVRYESEAKLFLGTGVVRMQRHQLFKAELAPNQAGIAVKMKISISGVPSIGDLSSAVALLQNLPSIVCVRVLNPKPDERILDMCASPGNKTTHIAELMQDSGVIIALDKTDSKIKSIKEKIVQNDLHCVKTYAFDATTAHDIAKNNSVVDEIKPPFASNTFKRILLDAPCSGLGNRPILLSTMTPKMIRSYPNLQRKLFSVAVKILEPQGTLVYSTCTVTEEENECMVAWALQIFPELQLVNATPKFGGPGLANTGLSDEERHMVQRFGPSKTNANKNIDTVGFFIAKFVKKSF